MILVQNRSVDLAQAEVDLETARLSLANYLWTRELVPLEPEENLRPEVLDVVQVIDDEERIGDFLVSADAVHPELLLLDNKLEQLEVKQRLKREALKPRVDVNYNFLGSGFDLAPESLNGRGTLNNLFTQNYKWGVEAGFPLLFRKERGGLQLVQIEQSDTQFKLQQKRLEIRNKVLAAWQQLQTMRQQLNVQEQVLVNYQRLLEGENEKFRIGESSIFLLNSREQKLIETELKLAKLRATLQKQQYKLQAAMGQLR
ncbi:MAG: TolC family protein, partial [Bacteroidota bacterium]